MKGAEELWDQEQAAEVRYDESDERWNADA